MFKTKDRMRLPGTTNTMAWFLRDERGGTAIEYAIVASGIAVAIAASVTSLGSSVKGLFTDVSTSLK